MDPKFKPMLGASLENTDQLRYPIMASPKLDGIRAVWVDGKFHSRTLKPIPNVAVSAAMRELTQVYKDFNFNGLDGELIAGSPTDKHCFNKTTRAVMTQDASADNLTFHVFDSIDSGRQGFKDRYMSLPHHIEASLLTCVRHVVCKSTIDVMAFEEQCLTEGYEGVILRNPDAPYKFGRSTLNEQGLVKLKRFQDCECKVVGFEEQMHNDNEAKLDERGYTKRSSHKANQRPAGTLGAIVVEWQGRHLSVGTGFTASQRAAIWQNRLGVIGRIAKIKYLPVGMLDLPRHPVFIGWPGEGTY